jgi:hypothetical protein
LLLFFFNLFSIEFLNRFKNNIGYLGFFLFLLNLAFSKRILFLTQVYMVHLGLLGFFLFF